MSAELTGELIEADVAARHDALMRRFAEGACTMCVALFEIRKGETYRARGFKSWKAFLRSVGVSETNGRRWANCGPLLAALVAAGEGDLVRHPDMLRPIAGMLSTRKPETNDWTVQRQLGIVRNAAARSRREQVPLDEKLIADCARRVGWNPDGRGAKPKDDAPKTEEEFRADMRKHIELAFEVVLNYRRTGYELEREIGLSKVEGFNDMRELLNDASDSAE